MIWAQTFCVNEQPVGYLNLVVGPQIYALYTDNAYPARTADRPGQQVIYTPAVGALAQKNQENVFALAYRSHYNGNHMDRALIDHLYLVIVPNRAQDLRDNVLAIANPSFLQVCDAAVAMWGHTTPS